MTAEADALLSNGASTPPSGRLTPSNVANSPERAPSYGSTVRFDAQTTHILSVNTNADPERPGDKGKYTDYPVVGWDVTDTAGLGYHICFRSSPWRLLFRDFRWVFAHLYLTPWMFLPASYTKSKFHPIAFIGQILMIIISLVITAGLVSGAVVSMPPFILAVAVLLLFLWIAEKAQGGITRVVTSTEAVGVDKEVWFL